MALDTTRLQNGAAELGLKLDNKQLEIFSIFASRLREENAKYNLVGEAGPETILVHHFLDSLSVVQGYSPDPGQNVLDLGSGAGFPGLVLAVVFSKTRFVLLDSSKKRTKFLKETIKLLGLGKAEAICGRAEEVGRDKDFRDEFDAVTARAVAPLPTLVEYAMPFIKTGGLLVAQRGRKAQEEVTAAAGAIRDLRGGPPRIVALKVPYLDADRRLVIIEKVGSTPDRYPRRTGVPLKRPL